MEGKGYRLAENEWKDIIPLYNDKINYCEIGVFCGHNIVSFANNFIKNNESKLYCIDPWLSYNDCPDAHYGNHSENYTFFKKNIKNFNLESKVVECRGFSGIELLKFENEYFDLIYIDGNHHEPYFEMDMELSYLKLKKGGIIIVDDCDHPPIGKKAVEIFENKYNLEVLTKKEQYFYRKN